MFGSGWFNLPLVDECNDLIDQMLEGKTFEEAELAVKKLKEEDQKK